MILKRVANKKQKFGEDEDYFPGEAIFQGKRCSCLFTEEQVEVAVERAVRKPELAIITKRPWWRFWGVK